MNFPPPPNTHSLAVLALTVIALVLFSRDKIPLESSSLFVLVALSVGFQLWPFSSDGKVLHAVDLFSGFGHEALIAVCALMIAGSGLVRTGALEPVGHLLARVWIKSPSLSLLLTLLVGAAASAFINNVPIVVLQMFDFLAPAAIAGALAVVYLWLVAPRIIPRREPPLADTSPRVFKAHLAILKGSNAEGKVLSEAIKLAGGGMKVSSIERGAGTFIFPLPDAVLQAGDHLVIQDTPDRLKEFETRLDGALYSLGDEEAPLDEDHPLRAEDQQIAEVVVVEGSRLHGTTLKRIRFAERYGLITLALHHAGKRLEPLAAEVGDIPFTRKAPLAIAVMACKTHLLIMNAGRYRFNDFVRIGAPLAAITWLAFSWILPLIYRLE